MCVKALQSRGASGVPSRAMRLALVLTALVAACDATPVPVTNCTPGVQTPCACPGGSSGAQRCNDTGSAFEACMCRDAEPPADVTTDAVAVTDVPQGDTGPDVVSDAGGDAVAVADGSGDAGDGLDPRCNPGFTRCEMPTPGCFDLQSETFHCGNCATQCLAPMWSGCRVGVCVP